MMIPKVIHYCWFGRNPKPEVLQKCINSWQEYCPDYEIVEWNEDNFDVNEIPFTKDAYADRKWAFVSDYARLKILYDHGGFYLDTDVMLHNSNIDTLRQYGCWFASDDIRYIATGLGFGCTAAHPVVKKLKDAYLDFEYPSGTNVLRDTSVLEKVLLDWKKSPKTQVLGDVMIIGVDDYAEYAQHLYAYTWADEQTQKERMQKLESGKLYTDWERRIYRFKCKIRNPKLIAYFDRRRGSLGEKIFSFCAYDLLDCGPMYFAKRLLRKIRRE